MSAFGYFSPNPDPHGCPVQLQEALRHYVNERIPTGGFLRAVLENDLRTAVALADPLNLAALRNIVAYAYEEIPSIAWGSPLAVAEWLERRT